MKPDDKNDAAPAPRVAGDKSIAKRISAQLGRKRRGRKRRKAAASALRAAALIAVLILLGVVVFRYKDELNPAKLTLGLSAREYGGDVERLANALGSSARYVPFGDGLAAAATSGVFYAGRDGNGGFRYDAGFKRPDICGGPDAALAYDRGGGLLVLLHRRGAAAEKTLDSAIIAADINARGYSAAAVEPPGYLGGIVVFDIRLEQVFSWKTPEYVCLSAAASECGAFAAAAAVCAGEDGAMQGKFLIFSVTREGAVYEKDLGGELPLAVYAAGDDFLLLCDGSLTSFSKEGGELRRLDFEGERLAGFARDGSGGVYLWFSLSSASLKHRVIYADASAAEVGRLELDRDVSAMAANGERLVLCMRAEIRVYDGMKLKKVVASDKGVEKLAVLRDKTVVLFTERGIGLA